MMSDGSFTVHCCRTRRLALPGGVLVCTDCDQAALVPKFIKATVVPEDVKFWQVPTNG